MQWTRHICMNAYQADLLFVYSIYETLQSRLVSVSDHCSLPTVVLPQKMS